MIERDNKRSRTLLVITSGMMEITWLYALSGLLFLLLNVPPFPIWAAVPAFFMPIMLISLLKGRGQRIIVHFLLHFFSYLIMVLYTIHKYGYGNIAFLDLKWIEMLLSKEFGAFGGFALFLVICCFSGFWYSGYKLIKRTQDHLTITSRFDLGIAMLVLVFLISAATQTEYPDSFMFISYYFLFSIFAIALAQNLKGITANNHYQFSRNGMVFTFILTVLLLTSWIILFFLPQMTALAQAGYYVLKVVSIPIGRLLLKILSLLFRMPIREDVINPSSPGGTVLPAIETGELSWWAQIIQWLITWGAVLLLISLTFLAIGWLCYSLWKWFSLKTELDMEKKGFWEEIRLWLKYIFTQFKKKWHKFYNSFLTYRKKEDISVLFQRLCRWGRHSGVARQKFQTPSEYGRHLAAFFPDSNQDIGLIIDGFNLERYGHKTIQPGKLIEIKKAWKRLASPSRWPLRLLTRVFYARKLSLAEAISSHS